MGSTESTLPEMEQDDAQEEPIVAPEPTIVNRATRRRRRRRTTETTEGSHSSSGGGAGVDDPWWWEVENENLVLDQAPNVAALPSANESVSKELSEDFNMLLKIGEHVNATLSNNKNNMSASNNSSESQSNENNISEKNTSEESNSNENKPKTSSSNESDNSNENNPRENFNENNPRENSNENNPSENLNENTSNKNNPNENLSVENQANANKIKQNNCENIDYKATTNESVTVSSDCTDYAVIAHVARKETHKNLTQAASNDLPQSDVTSATNSHREQTLEEYKEELRLKRLTRQTAVQDLRDEISTLRQQLTAERAMTRRLRLGELEAEETEAPAGACALATTYSATVEFDLDDVDPESRGRHANIELANAQLALQLANSENLSLRTELGVVHKQVATLKEVIACCKQMLAVKEEQCTQLKDKLQEIETSFAEREMRIMSDSLRHEYERQLGNIRQLRQLYEERQRVSAAEHENLQRLISIKRDELEAEKDKTNNCEERNQSLLKEVEIVNNELAALRDECNEHKFEKRALKEEMGAVNTLFSQMVMGFNGRNNLDIDRLTMMLEENRTLLNDMATKEASCSDGATLPKLLFELVEQAAVGNKMSSRSVTPTPTLADVSAGEEEQMEESATTVAVDDNDDNHGDNNNNEAGVEEEQQVELETEVEVAAQATDEDTATASTQLQDEAVVAATDLAATQQKAVNRSAKKHHRKNVSGNKTQAQMMSSVSVVEEATSSTACEGAAAAGGAVRRSVLKFHEPQIIGEAASAQEIIGNLPKVWKVLMELLSHHKIEQVQFEEHGNAEDCYKSVETPNGPKAELSVSKTYIKLKDLILEKKSLVKETNRLKTLNSHLDYRLNEQEKRLSAVSLELTKTWHLVGKMQRQHRQLHTQEQILRYQLQQKRRLLTELKDELEYCRRKWAAARAKNDESQEQWNDLRREFAKRKLDDANNSAESGYSDSGPASDEEAQAQAAGSSGGGISVASGSGGGGGGGACGSSSSACSRRKHFRELFEHTRKIKRMQSSSPGRDGCVVTGVELVLRWNSAPPTCGWRQGEVEEVQELPPRVLMVRQSGGAVPKARNARSKIKAGVSGQQQEEEEEEEEDEDEAELDAAEPSDGETGTERASRIQRLEAQCKSLIQQVLETSDNRERLEVQLCRFQDEIAPVQHAMPLDEFINRRRLERMTRASSVPATGTLTPREEEYTRKRSERLGRLEEESRQLMSRIKRTADRGHYLRCSLDRIRRAPSREGSCESSAEEELQKREAAKAMVEAAQGVVGAKEQAEVAVEETTASTEAATDTATTDTSTTDTATTGNSTTDTATTTTTVATTATELLEESPLVTVSVADDAASLLTATEEAYTARRAARLQRLEEEGRQLLSTLSRNTQRGDSLGSRLDTLHERHLTANEEQHDAGDSTALEGPVTIEQRLEDIEKISSNREQRLLILEEEGKQLLSRLSNTSERGTRMINRIAEREQSRQARLSATPSREGDSEVAKSETPLAAATALLPPLKNVACSSIVDEELAECVTVTTTASQIARLQQGAVPKTQPVAQLCAARTKVERRESERESNNNNKAAKESESLEEMVKRLQTLPFPAVAEPKEETTFAPKEEEGKEP